MAAGGYAEFLREVVVQGFADIWALGFVTVVETCPVITFLQRAPQIFPSRSIASTAFHPLGEW